MSRGRPKREQVSKAAATRIYLRDEWTCKMPVCQCPDGRAIDPALRGKDSSWAPSIDHIILRAAGGTKRDENMRAAHRMCNGSDRAARQVSRLISHDMRRHRW
jgi:HNH endonuclease